MPLRRRRKRRFTRLVKRRIKARFRRPRPTFRRAIARSKKRRTIGISQQVPFNNTGTAMQRPHIRMKALNKLMQTRNITTIRTTQNTVGSGIMPFTYCRQQFVESARLIGGSNPTIQAYRPTSTFQCNITNSSGQPKGRDVMATLYDVYVVTSCSYIIKVRNVGSVHTRTWVAISQDGTTSAIDSWDEALSSPSTKTAVLSDAAENDGNDVATFTGNIVLRKYLRSSDVGNYQTAFMSTVGTNPTQDLQLQFLAQTDTSTAPAASSLKLDVMLTYKVIYFNPKKGALNDT